MAEERSGVDTDEIRAAVRAGILSEAQAAELKALSDARAGHRTAQASEDEPFELFRGFAEIFVAIGLAILLGGISLLLGIVGGVGILVVIPVIIAAISWWMAGYFTLRWRMNLPSMVLAAAFGGGVYVSAFTMLVQGSLPDRGTVILSALVAMADRTEANLPALDKFNSKLQTDRFEAQCVVAVAALKTGMVVAFHATPPLVSMAQRRIAMASASLSSAGLKPRARAAAIMASLLALPLPVAKRLMVPTGTPS